MITKTTQWIIRGLLVFVVMMLALATIASPTFAQGPSGSGKGMVTKPKPPAQAKSVADTPEWDKVADTVAKASGFKNYVYEAWELPATATWDDTFKYYNDQLKSAGWSGEGQVQDYKDGSKGGAWIDSTTSTGVIVVYTPSPDGTKPAYDFAIFGTTTPVPKGMTDWKPLPSGDLDKPAGQLAQALGFTDYVVEAFSVPVTTKWDDVFKYYNDQMTQSGWSGQGVEQQLDKDTKVGLYLDTASKSGLVLIQIALTSSTSASSAASSSDSPASVVVAIFGWTTTSGSSTSSASSVTSSSSSLSVASSSANSNLSPAATDKYPLPKGKAGFVFQSYCGQEIVITIAGTKYKLPPKTSGTDPTEVFIILDPGKYNWGADVPGFTGVTDTFEVGPDTLSAYGTPFQCGG